MVKKVKTKVLTLWSVDPINSESRWNRPSQQAPQDFRARLNYFLREKSTEDTLPVDAHTRTQREGEERKSWTKLASQLEMDCLPHIEHDLRNTCLRNSAKRICILRANSTSHPHDFNQCRSGTNLFHCIATLLKKLRINFSNPRLFAAVRN